MLPAPSMSDSGTVPKVTTIKPQPNNTGTQHARPPLHIANDSKGLKSFHSVIDDVGVQVKKAGLTLQSAEPKTSLTGDMQLTPQLSPFTSTKTTKTLYYDS